MVARRTRLLAMGLVLQLAFTEGGADPGHVGAVQALEFARALSGSLVPMVAAGVKIGEYARDKLNAERFTLTVTAELSLSAPESYLLDGLQVATGATLGNRRLVYRPADTFKVRFENDEGASLTVRLSKQFPKDLEKLREEWGDDEIVALYVYNVVSIQDMVEEIP